MSQPQASDEPRILIFASFGDSVVSFRGSLIRALQACGYVVYVCAPFDPVSSAFDDVARLGARPIRLSMSRTGLNPLSDLVYFVRLFLVARKLRPAIVFAYTVKPVIYGLFAAWFCGVRRRYALITGLGYAFGGDGLRGSFVSSVVRRLYRWGLKRASLVFFQNPDDERLFRELRLLENSCPSAIVNGSGVDVDVYAAAPLPAKPAFLMIARLLGAKGVREYVGAARLLRKKHPEATFSLAGWIDEGPDAISEGELRSWAEEGAISFLGWLDDVRPAMEECSVYVLPSYREGTPRSVLEAMAAGRAIITTDVPGCRETVINGKNGFLVPARSVPDLVTAMERLIVDEPLRASMGRASRRIAVDKYDVRKVNEAMLREMRIGC